MGEGQFPKCSDSSPSITAASARSHVALEAKLSGAVALQTTSVTWWYQTVKSV